MIESLSDKVVLANSMNWAGALGNVMGFSIGTFTSIDEQDITDDERKQQGSERYTPATFKVPDHLEALFQKACQNKVIKEWASRLAELHTQYQAVFSQNDQDVKKTDLVQHGIRVQEGTWPIRQPPSSGASEWCRRWNARYRTFWKKNVRAR